MHQHPRPSPRAASAASNPSTNPERTNNSRDRPPHRTRSSVDLASYTERAGGEAAGSEQTRTDSATASGSHDRELTKLNQIIQHFHTKAALMVCSARATLPHAYTKSGDIRQNRWFNIVIDDTDVLVDDLHEWRRPDLSENKPPPLVIEVFLDTSNIGQGQALVVVDDAGRRWDVADALSASTNSSPPATKNGGKYCEVILEQWTIQLDDPRGLSASDLNDQLPNVYKKGVVLFRSLYTFLRFLPAWKLYRRLGRQPGNQQAVKLKFRIRQSRGSAYSQKDSLFTPLCPSDSTAASADGTHMGDVRTHAFDALRLSAGCLSVVVDYRANQQFSVADSEALLSSRFVGLDERIPSLAAGRSLPAARAQQQQSRTQYGSAAESRTTAREPRALLGAYGSLGTFHATGARASPVSALKQRTEEENDDDSDNVDRLKPLSPSSDRDAHPYRYRLNDEQLERSPFKAGSLSSSPRPTSSPHPVTPPKAESNGQSYQSESTRKFIEDVKNDKDAIRAIGKPRSESGKRNSLNPLPQQALRTPSIPNETAIASSGSQSPKPAPATHRYSSSFAGRTKRPPSGTSNTGKSADSAGSSARGSTSDQAGGESSGASGVKTDDDSLQDFISLTLEANKKVNLSRSSSRGHSINLSKYSSMRDPNMQLAEEMSASSLIQHSSTPPSRRLSNVPGLSTSSSPSRALAQHAPHVRSRLSTHSIAEEVTGASGASGEGSDSPNIREEEEDEEDEEPFIFPIHEA